MLNTTCLTINMYMDKTYYNTLEEFLHVFYFSFLNISNPIQPRK